MPSARNRVCDCFTLLTSCICALLIVNGSADCRCCQGDTVASCDSSGCVILWDVRATTPLKTIDCGPSAANMVAFDPPGMFPLIVFISVTSCWSGATRKFLYFCVLFSYKHATGFTLGKLERPKLSIYPCKANNDNYVFSLTFARWRLRVAYGACALCDNLYSPSKHGRTINSTNQDTNTNQIKTKTVTERTENTWSS